MPRPTDAQRRANPQQEVIKGNIRGSDGVVRPVNIIAKTKPNSNGGWDTEMHVPPGHVGARREIIHGK